MVELRVLLCLLVLMVMVVQGLVELLYLLVAPVLMVLSCLQEEIKALLLLRVLAMATFLATRESSCPPVVQMAALMDKAS